MLSLAHTLISLPLALYVHNPILIFAIAFVGHIFCDTFLHWNIYPLNFRRYPLALVFLDVAGGLAIAWLLVGDSVLTLPFLAAIAGGNMPDILHGLWEMLAPSQKKVFPRFIQSSFRWHERVQWETNTVAAGLVAQLAFIGLSLYFISRF